MHRHFQRRVRRCQGRDQTRQPGDCRQFAHPESAGAAQAGGTAHLLLQTVCLLQQPTRQRQQPGARLRERRAVPCAVK